MHSVTLPVFSICEFILTFLVIVLVLLLLLLINWILVGKIILWATSIFFLLAQDITTVFWHLMFLWRSLRSALSCLFYKFLPPYSLYLKLSSFTRIWKTCQFLLVLHYFFLVLWWALFTLQIEMFLSFRKACIILMSIIFVFYPLLQDL